MAFGNWNSEVLAEIAKVLEKGSSFARRTAALSARARRPRDSRLGSRRYALVAAGVVLRGHQHQALAGGNGLGLCRMAERAQDAEDGQICGQDSEAEGSDHSEAEDNGHQERSHGLNILLVDVCRSWLLRIGESNSVVCR